MSDPLPKKERMVCQITLRRFPDQGVAEWPWNQWPDGRGISGRMGVESVAGWAWNTQYDRHERFRTMMPSEKGGYEVAAFDCIE